MFATFALSIVDSINETKSTYILADKQAIEDELFIDGGKHVIACF